MNKGIIPHRWHDSNICTVCGNTLGLRAKTCSCGGDSTGVFPIMSDGSYPLQFMKRFCTKAYETVLRLGLNVK